MDTPAAASYSLAEKRTRIGVYVAMAVVAALTTNLLSLAAMSDQQLAAITPLRWTITILLAALGASGAGLTAFRAAIDRSTAGGSGAATPDPNPTLAK